MRTFGPMTPQERSLHNLQRTLIARSFPGLTPREVRFVDAVDFDGRAREPRLELAARLAGAAEGNAALAPLMTHLLIHYEMKDLGQAHWRGHGPFFTRRAVELGVLSDTAMSRCCSLDDWLNDPALRSGRHAVHTRSIDVIFGLLRCYRDELHDFFLNERWLKGGGHVPDNLLPWVKFYSEEITDLLAVDSWVVALTRV